MTFTISIRRFSPLTSNVQSYYALPFFSQAGGTGSHDNIKCTLWVCSTRRPSLSYLVFPLYITALFRQSRFASVSETNNFPGRLICSSCVSVLTDKIRDTRRHVYGEDTVLFFVLHPCNIQMVNRGWKLHNPNVSS